MKKDRKEQAIQLRKQGKTYAEILQQIPVAKSTLSEWLKSVHLATPQKQRITQKRIAGALRGAQARKNKRLAQVEALNAQGIKEIGKLTQRELWLIGTALYWAEGSKQGETMPSTGIIFTNSDVRMLALFIKWLQMIGVPKSAQVFDLYVHENRTREIAVFKQWWAERLDITAGDFGAVYFKRDKIMTNRKNVTDLYHGLVRIRVRSSTVLNRRIQGWVEGVVQ